MTDPVEEARRKALEAIEQVFQAADRIEDTLNRIEADEQGEQ